MEHYSKSDIDYLYYAYYYVTHYYNSKIYGRSVRCLRDKKNKMLNDEYLWTVDSMVDLLKIMCNLELLPVLAGNFFPPHLFHEYYVFLQFEKLPQ